MAHSCAVKRRLMRVRGVSDETVKVCHIFQVLPFLLQEEKTGFESESRLLKVIELCALAVKVRELN